MNEINPQGFSKILEVSWLSTATEISKLRREIENSSCEGKYCITDRSEKGVIYKDWMIEYLIRVESGLKKDRVDLGYPENKSFFNF